MNNICLFKKNKFRIFIRLYNVFRDYLKYIIQSFSYENTLFKTNATIISYRKIGELMLILI